ncbi:hypothetical protein ACCC88_08305 [Sphingomonas sp. Sphisp140]|uniref:hypothetical protein n=1 Tax=unclassified Sphingomonas TaxID=196159 RepID=UPI0039AF3A2F
MEQRDVAPREVSRTGLAIGIVLLLLATLGIGGAWWFGTQFKEQAQSPEGIAESMLKDRTGKVFFEALQDSYPEEFAAYTAMVSKRVREGATREQIGRESFAWMRASTLRHRDEFVQAPHGDLNLYRQMEIQLIETLQQRDVALCDRYVMGTITSGGIYSPEVSERLVELAAAQITTSAAGRDKPVHRKVPRKEIARPDAVALVTAMRRGGMSQFDLETWGDAARMARARPEKRCAIGLHVLRGITSLPHEQGDRITGWLTYQQS